MQNFKEKFLDKYILIQLIFITVLGLLLIYYILQISGFQIPLLLKYYWFRLPDVMAPLFTFTLLAVLINNFINGNFPRFISSSGTNLQTRKILSKCFSPRSVVAGVIVILFSIIKISQNVIDFNSVNTWHRGTETSMV